MRGVLALSDAQAWLLLGGSQAFFLIADQTFDVCQRTAERAKLCLECLNPPFEASIHILDLLMVAWQMVLIDWRWFKSSRCLALQSVTVVPQLLERCSGCLLVSIKTVHQTLVAKCQVFDIGPCPKRLGALDLGDNCSLVRKLLIIQVSMVAEQERSEVKCLVRLFGVWTVDDPVQVQSSDDLTRWLKSLEDLLI